MNLLPAQIQMGAVMLSVVDLDLLANYYSEALGPRVLSEDVTPIVLGGYRG